MLSTAMRATVAARDDSESVHASAGINVIKKNQSFMNLTKNRSRIRTTMDDFQLLPVLILLIKFLSFLSNSMKFCVE